MKDTLYAFTVRRLVKADRLRVFDAFSRAEAVAQWFKPSADISVEVLAFEFVEGGSYRLRYTMPDGTRPVLRGTYERIAPPEELIFSWVWEPPDVHADMPTRVHARLLDKGGATEIVITHEKVPSEEVGLRHAAGWEGGLDLLERLLFGGKTSAEKRNA